MKNKFALIALLGLFLASTYTIYAQENQDTIIAILLLIMKCIWTP